MATESVDIIISAQDNASVVLQQAAENAKKVNQRIGEVGRSYSSAGEAIQKAARALGGGWMVDAGNQLKDIAEGGTKVAQILRAGGAAANVMKAGLVGLTATAAVFAGKALGDMIFQTERWRNELGLAIKEAGRLNDEVIRRQGQGLSQELQDIAEFGGSEEEKKAARDALVVQLQKDKVEVQKRLKQAELAKAKDEALFARGLRGMYTEDLQALEATIAEESARLNMLRQQEEVALGMFSEAEKEREAKRAAMEKEKKDQEDLAKAELERIEKKKKADEEAYQLRKKRALEDIEWAQQVQAERAGMIAESLNEDLEAARNEKVELDRTNLSGRESRMLTGRTSILDNQRQMQELAKKSLEEQKASKKVMENMLSNLKTIAGNLGVPDQVWEAN